MVGNSLLHTRYRGPMIFILIVYSIQSHVTDCVIANGLMEKLASKSIVAMPMA